MLAHNLDTEFQSNRAVMETVQTFSYSSQNGTLLESTHGWKRGLRGLSKCSVCMWAAVTHLLSLVVELRKKDLDNNYWAI